MRFALPGVAFVVLIGFFLVGLRLNPAEVPSPLLAKPAPAFVLPTLHDPDKTISNENLRGSISLVNVWATWCVGCRQEHDALLAIAGSTDIPIYGLNWKDERPRALAWLEQLGDPYTAVAFDEEGRVAIDWGVYGAPETFLVDGDGIVRHKHVGPISAAIWQRDFLPLIKNNTRTATAQ